MKRYIGVDIGKHNLDIYIDGQHIQVANNNEGFEEFMNKLRLNRPLISTTIIVYEPTGGYEKLFVKHSRGQELALHSAHANHVRNFIKAKGLRAKTDKIDSKILVEYAMAMKASANDKHYNESREKLGFF